MFRAAGGYHGGRRPWTGPRLILPAVAVIACALLLLSGSAGANHNSPHAVAISAVQQHAASPAAAAAGGATVVAAAAAAAGAAGVKVPVTLYVMSQCPDAKFCQNAFQPVLGALPSLITLQTQYIAELNKDEDGVSCMHGSRECEGNKQQLCMQASLPAAENRKYFAALLCHSKGNVADVQHLKACMGGEAGISADAQAKVLQCVSGVQGTTLQVASAKDVKANAVKKSCTVFIDGTKRCVRDGGRWYDCDGGSDVQDFIRQVCEAHKAKAGAMAAECAAALAGDGRKPQ